MEAIAKSDLFFMITSVVVVLLGALLITAVVYILNILHDVRNITHTVRDESERIKEDLDEFRTTAKKGIRGLRVWGFIKTILGTSTSRKRKSKD